MDASLKPYISRLSKDFMELFFVSYSMETRLRIDILTNNLAGIEVMAKINNET